MSLNSSEVLLHVLQYVKSRHNWKVPYLVNSLTVRWNGT